MAAYVCAIEMSQKLDMGFTTGCFTSVEAAAVWDRLVAAGVAEIVWPFVMLEPPDTLQGDYRVRP